VTATLNLILLVAGFILFVLAGLGVSGGRLQLGWLGLACITLAVLLTGGI
jgi:hypothetical protein